MADEVYWQNAVEDLKKFNVLYAKVEKKPQDLAVLQQCARGVAKFTGINVWRTKCLVGRPADALKQADQALYRLSKNKAASVEELSPAVEAYKAAVQAALDSTSPESFTYQGFKIQNEQHFAEVLCMHALEGLDYLKALFKKRGVVKILDYGIAQVTLVYEMGSVAYLHSGTRELVISVSEITKTQPSRIISGTSFGNETLLHEFGHFVHLNYIKGEAREAWNSPWEGIENLADPKNRHLPEDSKTKRDERLAPLDIVTEYGKVNQNEDFAETFVAFMAAPEKLTPVSKFRMQRALSLSGLYGKAVMPLLAQKVAARYRVARRVASRYQDQRED